MFEVAYTLALSKMHTITDTVRLKPGITVLSQIANHIRAQRFRLLDLIATSSVQ